MAKRRVEDILKESVKICDKIKIKLLTGKKCLISFLSPR